jgi:hypothetical protein
MARTDIVLPVCTNDKTDSDSPRRANERRLTLEPIFTPARMEHPAPICRVPNTLAVDPNLANPLIDRDDPEEKKSKIDAALPMRITFLIDKLLPSITESKTLNSPPRRV